MSATMVLVGRTRPRLRRAGRVGALKAIVLLAGCSRPPPRPEEPPVLFEGRQAPEWVRSCLAGDREASESLARFEKRDEPAFIRLATAGLRSSETPVREWAACKIGDHGGFPKDQLEVSAALKEAVLPLAQALKEDAPFVKWGAAWSLGRIGPPAKEGVPALIRALERRDDFAPPGLGDESTRVRAARALSHIGAPEGVPALIAATRDRDPNVRRMALQSLWVIDDHVRLEARSFVVPVLRAIEDEDSGVR